MFCLNSYPSQIGLVKIQRFSNILAKIKYFVNVSDRVPILFECFGYEYDNFWTFSEKVRYFKNISRIILIVFWMFWAKTTYFSKALSWKEIFFECFGTKRILFKCFLWKFKTFLMFWDKMKYLSNGLDSNIIFVFLIFWIQIQFFSNVLRQYGRFSKYFL